MNPSFLGVFAHLGCMGALQHQGLLRNLTGLSGASAGAQCGSILASGRQILDPTAATPALHEDLRSLATVGERRWQVLDPAPGFGVLVGQGLEDEMSKLVAPAFEDLSLPFACTAWSAYALRTEILCQGPLPRAVRASCTVPLLFHPTSTNRRRWLLDGGIQDPSGSVGLRVLPQQPERSLHVVINRRMVPGLDGLWSRALGPSMFGTARQEVVTLRLNRPPSLLLGEQSFRQVVPAIETTAAKVMDALDAPLVRGAEEGHYIVEVDVAWGCHSRM